jgi:hypothetical protein
MTKEGTVLDDRIDDLLLHARGLVRVRHDLVEAIVS